MSVIDELASCLIDHDVPYERDPDSLAVNAESDDRFRVSLVRVGDEWIVGYGDVWHHHCDDDEDAIACFLFALTDQCRLKSVFRGSVECHATLQAFLDGKWGSVSMTGLLLVPFWRKRTVKYRQNNLLPSPMGSMPTSL